MPLRLTLILMLTLAAGCGRQDSTPAPKNVSAAQPLTLQVFGDPAEIAAYRELVADYQTRHPGRRVTLIPVGKQKDHMAKLTAAFASGRAPDLFVLNFRRFGQLAERGLVEPVGPALAGRADFVEDDFFAPALDAFRIGGTLMCAPQNVSSLVVYYNRGLFERHGVPLPRAGWTITDLIQAAQRLTLDLDRDGNIDIYGLALEPTLIRIAPFIWGMGGDIVNDLDNPTMLTFDRIPALRALNLVRSLNSQFRLVPPLVVHKAEDAEARFARGGLAMLFQSRRLTTTLRAFPELDWDVAPFPRLGQPAGVLHADAYCLAHNSPRREAALEFIAYAVSAAGQDMLTRNGRLVPARKSVAYSEVFLDPAQRPASAQVFLDAIPLLRRTPNIAEWHEIETRADTLLEEWFYEMPVGGMPAEEAGGEGAIVAVRLRDAIQPILLRRLGKQQK